MKHLLTFVYGFGLLASIGIADRSVTPTIVGLTGTLEVRVQDPIQSPMSIKGIENFTITNQSYSITEKVLNGKTTSTHDMIIRVKPKKSGEFVLGPIDGVSDKIIPITVLSPQQQVDGGKTTDVSGTSYFIFRRILIGLGAIMILLSFYVKQQKSATPPPASINLHTISTLSDIVLYLQERYHNWHLVEEKGKTIPELREIVFGGKQVSADEEKRIIDVFMQKHHEGSI